MLYKIKFGGGGTYYYCSEACVGVEAPEHRPMAVPVMPKDIPEGQHCFGCSRDLNGQRPIPPIQSNIDPRRELLAPTRENGNDAYGIMEYRYFENRGAFFRSKPESIWVDEIWTYGGIWQPNTGWIDEVWTPERGWFPRVFDLMMPVGPTYGPMEPSELPAEAREELPDAAPAATPNRPPIGIDRTKEWAGKAFQILAAPALAKTTTPDRKDSTASKRSLILSRYPNLIDLTEQSAGKAFQILSAPPKPKPR